jgi:hypothetical protein
MRQTKRLKQMMKARELYMSGEKCRPIAEKMGIRRQQVYEWAIANSWEEQRLLIIKKAETKSDTNLQREIERSLKIMNAVEVIYGQELMKAQQEGKGLPDTTQAFAAIERTKFQMLNPIKINQYNKYEQINHPKIFKVVLDNGTGNNRNRAVPETTGGL